MSNRIPLVLSKVSFNSPQVVSTPLLWLDAATTPIGAIATSWADKSGNGNNAILNNGVPVCTANRINGKNSIRFTSDSLLITDNAGLRPGADGYTIFIVSQNNVDTATEFNLLRKWGDAGNLSYLVDYGNDASPNNIAIGICNDGTNADFITPAQPTLGTATLLTIVGRASASINSESFLNSVSTGTTTRALYASTADIEIGSSAASSDIDIGEIIIYPRELSTAERVQVESYLLSKWAIRDITNVPSIVGWWEADSGITKAYSTLLTSGKNVTGTVDTYTLVSAGNLSLQVIATSSVKIDALDVYTVASISTVGGISTITTNEVLTNSYSSKTIALERVSQINDKTINAYNGTATSTEQMIFIPSGDNGKPSLLVSAATNRFTLPSGIYGVAGGDNTVYVVMKAAAQDTYNAGLFTIENSSTRAGINLELTTTGTGNAIYSSGVFASAVATGDIIQTAFSIYKGRRSGVTLGISQDNSVEITNSNGTDVTANLARLGGGAAVTLTVTGEYQAWITCNTSIEQGSPDDIIINNYLKNKYGTA